MTANILIVDDVKQNVELLQAKLTQEYYNVITASDGFEALNQVKAFSIDIILLDVMMPGMDGFECCKLLKQDPQTSNIPVVMVTALHEIADRVKGLKAGAEDFLTKPIREPALLARIKSLVRVKAIFDELKIRNKTGLELGVNDNYFEKMQLNNIKILLVEDDVVQAKLLKNMLTEKHAEITVISNDFDKVLENINMNNYDLAIISTQLADIDGLRICSQIKNNEKSRHMPLLAMVEEDNDAILIKALDIGVNDYLITPIELSEVEARIVTQVKRKRYQDLLRNNYNQALDMALTDGLTNLYNRRYFDNYLKQLIEKNPIQNKFVGLVLMDIDKFKNINDEYGHPVGDEVLKEFANRLKSQIRITDLAARYGGEEFTAILPNTNIEEAKMIAERIRESICSKPFKIDHEPFSLNVTVSIGVSILPEIQEKDKVISIFIDNADKALYSAKEKGRNNVQIYKI